MLDEPAPHPPGEMPFLDHLEELRWTIIRSLAAVVIGVGVAFALLLRYDVVGFLERPILPYLHGRRLIYTHPGAALQITLTAAATLGVLLALPVVIQQAWSFLRPGLYRHERRVILAVFFGATCLFLSGAALAYFVVLPLALPWLMEFGTGSLEPMITATEYFDFVSSLCLSFGVCFELPVVILALAALGLVTPSLLNRFRRHAVVACTIVGAFLTPGDLVWTTIAMAVPLYLLYEISVVLSYWVHARRRRSTGDPAMVGGP
jgi:sec-independent protein translocase protein TatC